MALDMVPERGDVIWIDFSPQKGHEQAGRRPSVVLSPSSYNRTLRLALLCPITSRVKNYPFEVALPEGLPVSGVVLADQVRSFDLKARRMERIGHLPDATVKQILKKVQSLLT
jgi:mRNA interferase MazF